MEKLLNSYTLTTVSRFSFALLALLASNSSDAESLKIQSPSQNESVSYNCSQSTCSAWIDRHSDRLFFFKNLPINAVTARWISSDIAQVSFSCGSPCSVSFFYKESKGISKDIHDILAISIPNECALIPTDDGIATIYLFDKNQDRTLWHARYNDRKFDFNTQSATPFSTIKAKFNADNTLELNYQNSNNSLISRKIKNPCIIK